VQVTLAVQIGTSAPPQEAFVVNAGGCLNWQNPVTSYAGVDPFAGTLVIVVATVTPA